jgi:hypothetical protein
MEHGEMVTATMTLADEQMELFVRQTLFLVKLVESLSTLVHIRLKKMASPSRSLTHRVTLRSPKCAHAVLK